VSTQGITGDREHPEPTKKILQNTRKAGNSKKRGIEERLFLAITYIETGKRAVPELRIVDNAFGDGEGKMLRKVWDKAGKKAGQRNWKGENWLRYRGAVSRPDRFPAPEEREERDNPVQETRKRHDGERTEGRWEKG